MNNGVPLRTVPAVQSADAASGHAGSRAGLLPFPGPAPRPPGKQLDADFAVKNIKDAQLNDLAFVFEQANPNPKTRVCGLRVQGLDLVCRTKGP